MKLQLDPTALTFLPEGYDTFILTQNDGTNEFSEGQGCCLIGQRFLIVPVKETVSTHAIALPSNQFHFFTSEYDAMFLTGDLTLKKHDSYRMLILSNENGILDSNVQVAKMTVEA